MEALSEEVSKIFGKDEALTGDDFRLLRRYCAIDEKSSELLNSLDDAILLKFVERTFEVALAGCEGVEKPCCEETFKLMKLALQSLVNAVNRSFRFRECFGEQLLTGFRLLLRIESVRTETFALLVSIAPTLHKRSQLSTEYPALLTELVHLWNGDSITMDQRNWLSAYFSIHVENDFAFLADCFAQMDSDTFTDFLRIVDSLVDHIETGEPVKFHLNNARFCVNLLERMEFEFGESAGKDKEEGKAPADTCFLEKLELTVSIISSLALIRPDFDPALHADSAAVCLIISVLEAIIDYEICRNNMTPEVTRAPDRPTKPVIARREAARFAFVGNLSRFLRSDGVKAEDIGCLKRNCVQAIGNLCCESELNRHVAGERDAVILVLHCAKRIDSDCPFQVQWAITAIRHLCINCPENQIRLAQVDKIPSTVIDTQRILRELGLRAVVASDDGRVKLERINE